MSANICLFPPSRRKDDPQHNCLDAHEYFVRAARSLYAPNVVWTAPARGILWQGCELVIRQLLREAGGMHEPEFTHLLLNKSEQQAID